MRTVVLATVAAVLIVALMALANSVPPPVVLWTGVTTTTLCSLGSLGVVWLGWRGSLAEVAMTGVVLLTVPLLELAGTLSEQGLLSARPGAAPVAAAAAAPLAVLAGAPLLVPDSRLRSHLSRWWRAWTGLWLGVVVLLTAALLWTSLRPALPGAPVLTATTLAGVLLFCGIGWRHLALFRVGRQFVSLLVGANFMALGLVSVPLRPVGMHPSIAFVTMMIDVTLSFVAIGGIAVVGRRLSDTPTIMAPITNRDPLVALRLGLDPVVLEFMERVGCKDPGTREHIVRVGELAMRVGIRAGIEGAKLRALGIGALLHDIGKLVVPDEVLRKPGALTDSEYEIIKRHSSAGARLLLSSPVLAASAGYVRWHHERPDGTGYPDGLTGDDIPLDVAIVSVCDAYDAMTQDRHYRSALTSERALAILDEHSGSQFDVAAVQLLRAELATNPLPTTVFASLGGTAIEGEQPLCGHALPVGRQLPRHAP